MVKEFQFFDFVEADNGGTNLINNWLNGEGKRAKAYFNIILKHLEQSSPPGSNDTQWCLPNVRFLKGDWKGFFELRKKVDRTQYRLIGALDRRNVYLVTWGKHQDTWETDITPGTGKLRVKQMTTIPAKHRREHDFR